MEARAQAPLRRLLLSDCRDFWRLWTVGLVVFVIRWLETVAVGVFVYRHTGSAFLVAMMTMLRLLPMGLFGMLLGAWAERIERRSALIGVVVMMGATSATLAVLAHAGALQVWHLGLASFVNGIGWATDNPVRRVMIGEVVGPTRMSVAMSVDIGANNASRMVGPTLGGLLFAGVGLDGTFAVSVVLYGFALLAALRVRYRNAAPSGSPRVITRMLEGLRLVRSDPKLIGTLVITVIYNVFGWPFTSMIPVIGQDRLGLGPTGIGALASLDGIGAFCGAILLAVWLKPAWYARTYLTGVTLYLVMLTVFALVPNAAVASLALLMTGFAGAAFSIMQATLVYLSVPPEMRSRILGVLSMCIGIGPVGFLALGLLADAVGAPAATAASGVAGLAMLAVTRRWWGRI
jgi:MFS family permease